MKMDYWGSTKAETPPHSKSALSHDHEVKLAPIEKPVEPMVH